MKHKLLVLEFYGSRLWNLRSLSILAPEHWVFSSLPDPASNSKNMKFGGLSLNQNTVKKTYRYGSRSSWTGKWIGRYGSIGVGNR